METIDYNGTGSWSRDAVLRRYAQYAEKFHVALPLDLTPDQSTQGQRRWIYPVMMKVIDGIERGDRACIELGVEFIESDDRFAFGRILKSNSARALRRAELGPGEQERVRRRVVSMLVAGQVPHEYQEYAKLLRKVGLGNWRAHIEAKVNRDNPYVMRYHNYFQRHA